MQEKKTRIYYRAKWQARRYRLCLIFFLVLNAAQSTYGQYYNQYPDFLKANGVWAFQNKVGLNFNTGGPATFISASNSAVEGAASVADRSTGQLLFYSDGQVCINRNHNFMPNGLGLKGNSYLSPSGIASSVQGVCIVPVANNVNQYYLFSLESFGGKLYYSIVDMTLAGGLGNIIPGKKNILLDSSSLGESMIAVPGSNCDIWLLVHADIQNLFKAYHITEDGIELAPVLSATGASNDYAASMTLSPDRTKLAFKSSINLQLFRFDAASGIVSDGMTLSLPLPNSDYYGTAFSPDNTKLYEVKENGNLYQYDITVYDSATIVNSKNLVGGPVKWGLLKLYNDTIYCPPKWGTFDMLCRINNPNLPGAACGFQQDAVQLPTVSYYYYSFPNEVPLPASDTFYSHADTTICGQGQELKLTVKRQGATGIIWDNGHTDTVRTVPGDGTYWVRYKAGCIYTDTITVKSVRLDTLDLGADTTLCNTESPIRLHANIDDATYQWQDNSTAQDLLVSHSGTYRVQVAKDGCTAADTILVRYKDLRQYLGPDSAFCRGQPIRYALAAQVPPGAAVLWSTGADSPVIIARDAGTYTVWVTDAPCQGVDSVVLANDRLCDCRFLVPNAFSPNGDGKNDDFGLQLEPGCVIMDYMLRIYNRWGELVYESTSPGNRWQGFHKSKPADAGTYFYQIHFSAGTNRTAYQQKGDLALIR